MALIPANSGGGAITQGTIPWVVDGSAVTQPISTASLPLPTGAATEASLAAIRAATNDIAFAAILESERQVFL